MEDTLRRIEVAEDRVRRLLMDTCGDDSYGTQVELREAIETLQELRRELAGYGEGSGAAY
jgi:hypothetical protein